MNDYIDMPTILETWIKKENLKDMEVCTYANGKGYPEDNFAAVICKCTGHALATIQPGGLRFWRDGDLPFADPKFFKEAERRLKRERQKAHKKWEMGN